VSAYTTLVGSMLMVFLFKLVRASAVVLGKKRAAMFLSLQLTERSYSCAGDNADGPYAAGMGTGKRSQRSTVEGDATSEVRRRELCAYASFFLCTAVAVAVSALT
jgi:hypothetical protein